MKRLLIVPAVILCSVTSVLAGASSENRLGDKALEGPEGKGAHSTDPNVERSGSPGPSGPSDQGSTTGNRPAGSQYNDYGTGSGAGTSGAAGSGSSGSGASGSSGSGTSGSGSSGMSPHKTPGSAQ